MIVVALLVLVSWVALGVVPVLALGLGVRLTLPGRFRALPLRGYFRAAIRGPLTLPLAWRRHRRRIP
jgi:hypothetical protein